MIAIDTETTGLDFKFGAKPFMVTICERDKEPVFWEWDVDPFTREVNPPQEDVDDIKALLASSDAYCLQNSKFDVKALETIGIKNWRWDITNDTLIAGHLLASNHAHNLTDMVVEYLGVNIEPLELEMKEACTEARRLVRTKAFKRDFGEWMTAKEGLECMPSAKEKCWKFDMWLPRAIAVCLEYKKDHPWWSVTSKYSNADSYFTVRLWDVMEAELKRRELWEIYLERIKVIPVAFRIEDYGVTINKERKDELYIEYEEESDKSHRICVNLADGDLKKLPVNGRSNALNDVIFNKFGLQSNKMTKKGNDSMDKDVLEHWMLTLPARSKPYLFVKNLRAYRKRKTAMGYMEGYEKFWRPLTNGLFPDNELWNWYRLHPFLNATGTDTLRWSSNNPNEQNISKKEGFNLRYCFGPAPGREWWSCDAQNIELRLPAYEAREEAMIELFERPNDGPYYGSNHLLVAHILHPRKFEACRNDKGEIDGRIFKKRYADTLYQYTKNGNFAVQYGAIATSGTADRAYHVEGAQLRIQARFNKVAKLNQWCIQYANKHGYIETIPDKTVNPTKGYPLLCTRTQYGRVLETVPLNYRIQGTACWWMMKAMIRVDAKLEEWRRHGFDGQIVMQVHDEMVFDFPKSTTHPSVDRANEGTGKAKWRTSNLWRIREIQRIMALGGDDIGIPTPVSCEYHEHDWSKGVTM